MGILDSFVQSVLAKEGGVNDRIAELEERPVGISLTAAQAAKLVAMLDELGPASGSADAPADGEPQTLNPI